jgi:hypothetical protein
MISLSWPDSFWSIAAIQVLTAPDVREITWFGLTTGG